MITTFEETASIVSLFTSLLVVQRYTVAQQEENSSFFAILTKLLWKNLWKTPKQVLPELLRSNISLVLFEHVYAAILLIVGLSAKSSKKKIRRIVSLNNERD